jgi:hypothetical protein
MTNVRSTDRDLRLSTVPEHGRIEPASPLTPLSQAEVCRRLRQLVGTHRVERFILFGSFARETQTWDSSVPNIIPQRAFVAADAVAGLTAAERILRFAVAFLPADL